MKGAIKAIGTFALLLAGALQAQDISGNWQGTMGSGAQSTRFVLKIARADAGWGAALTNLGNPNYDIPISADVVTLTGGALKLIFRTIPGTRGDYEGTVSADGASINGSWSFGGSARLSLDFQRVTPKTAWQYSLTKHSQRFVGVDSGVKLEVLDWGGSGRPVVLLAGLGNTAHVFDQIAPKLSADYHVYGVTRRGFGASSAPATGYSSDTLADDVLAVLDSLGLERPVLAGHSIAGGELSSIGSRHPERIAGLIYLDAGYPYAYYDRARGDLQVDINELTRKLARVQPGAPTELGERKRLVQDLLDTALPTFERDLRKLQDQFATGPAPSFAAHLPPPMAAALMGVQPFTEIRARILAIYALPHQLPPGVGDPAAQSAARVADSVRTSAQAEAFEHGIPSARVVRLPNANHYVFMSNEADVLREMRAFINGLPASPR
jgi:non-heme chloroperoxidase